MPRSIFAFTKDKAPSAFSLRRRRIDAMSPGSPFLTNPVETKALRPREKRDIYFVRKDKLYCEPHATPRPDGTRAAQFKLRRKRHVVVILALIHDHTSLFRGRLEGILRPIHAFLGHASRRDEYKPCDDWISDPCPTQENEIRVLSFWLSLRMYIDKPCKDHGTGLFYCLESLFNSEDPWEEIDRLLVELS